MPKFSLLPHPDTPPNGVEAVHVEVRMSDHHLRLTFIVDGTAQVALPDRLISTRVDDLWKTTCCELFLAHAGADAYFEFNYSPSTQWAAYRFDAYRAGGSDLPQSVDPQVERGDESSGYLVEVDQDLPGLPSGALQMGLSAVIEERDGTKSYWALAHAPGRPDFHNRHCFIANLRVPEG